MYAQALVGMVSVTAQWWLDVREPSKEVVAAHLVNLCWNGLTRLDPDPELVGPDYVEHKARTVGDATSAPSAEGSGTPEALESSDASVPSDSVESP